MIIIMMIIIIIIIIISIYFGIETLFIWSGAEGVAWDGRSDHLKGNLGLIETIMMVMKENMADDDDDEVDNHFNQEHLL